MRLSSGRGPYFAQIPFALLDDPTADAESIATYCALRRFTDFGSNKGCFASHKRLAISAGISVRTLKRRLEWLRDNGWINWEGGTKTGRSNNYSVNNSTDTSLAQEVGHSGLGGRPQTATRVGQPDPLPRDSNQETLTKRQKDSTPAAWVRSLAEDWSNIYGGIPSHGQIGRHLKPLVETHGFEPVQERWRHYLESTEGRFASAARFAQTYGSWDRAGGAPAQESYVSADDARVAFRAAGIPDSWAVNPDGYPSREALNLAIIARRIKLQPESVA
jgi:hypothetical protein